MLQQAKHLHDQARAAAPLTNHPLQALALASQWYEQISAKKKSSTFGLLSEDVIGILLAAHEAEPQRFAASLAVDVAGLSGVFSEGTPRPSDAALKRWRTLPTSDPIHVSH